MPYAIDLFCGAGGFSEGIIQAGFDIIFSSDKSPMVEETYTNRHRQLGLVEGYDTHFELADIRDLTSEVIFNSINHLRYGEIFEVGNVDVIFGGPPCQGFSRLGKRDSSDPRNMLFHEYLRIIRDVKPAYVVMENVTGILDMHMLDFPSVLSDEKYNGQVLVKDILSQELKGLGYTLLDVKVLNAANFGVPQQRNRVVFLAYRNDVTPLEYPEEQPNTVTVFDALGDLYNDNYDYRTPYSFESVQGRTPNVNGETIQRHELRNMEYSKHDSIIHERFSLYNEGENKRKAVTRYQTEGLNLRERAPHLFKESLFQLNSEYNSAIILEVLTELKLMNEKFSNIKWLHYTNRQLSKLEVAMDIDDSRQFQIDLKSLANRIGTNYENALNFWNRIFPRLNSYINELHYEELLLNGKIDSKISEAIFTKKGIRSRLNRDNISPTMVTLPDDFIHPYFDRVLTVREMARIQSFDDSFVFLGKRTTGGEKRSQETPQFTQVGNAVPPLLARAIAEKVLEAINE